MAKCTTCDLDFAPTPTGSSSLRVRKDTSKTQHSTVKTLDTQIYTNCCQDVIETVLKAVETQFNQSINLKTTVVNEILYFINRTKFYIHFTNLIKKFMYLKFHTKITGNSPHFRIPVQILKTHVQIFSISCTYKKI